MISCSIPEKHGKRLVRSSCKLIDIRGLAIGVKVYLLPLWGFGRF